MEYIRRRKLSAAADELRSGRKLLDIALDYGYETHAGFYKAFQYIFGCSPSGFKNNLSERGNFMSTISIEEITNEIKLNPNNAELYRKRGNHLHHAQPAKALEDYTKALELDPNIKDIYLLRGTTYNRLRKTGEAIADFTKGLEINPIDTWLYVRRGSIYCVLGERDKAEADFARVLELTENLNDKVAHESRARVYQQMREYLQLNQYDKEKEELDKLLKLSPEDFNAYIDRAFLYHQGLNQYEKAIEDYTKAIEFAYDETLRSIAYQHRADCYAVLQQHDKAEKDFEKALEYFNKRIELNPDDTYAHFNRGKFYQTAGRYTEALEDFTKAIEFHPKRDNSTENDSQSALYYSTRGQCYEEMANNACAGCNVAEMYEKAIADYKTALDIDSEFVKAHSLLHKLLKKQ
jgi:tetratricopeptide (TPR) repeat protein